MLGGTNIRTFVQFFEVESEMDFVIEKMTPDDWSQVRAIYLEGIATGNATFETGVPEWDVWDKKHRTDSRLVARAGDGVIAWVAATPVSARQVYAGVAEHSIYVAEAARGRGVGKALLQAFVEASELAGIWTLQTAIFPENGASMGLHKSCGFREVGYRERIGCMNGVWRNTVMLERRSGMVGI
jgi:phosphinothricin acetyltransferase